MNIEKLIGLALMAGGVAIAALAWMQTLFQHDGTPPLPVALAWAATAILTGAVAFRLGQRMAAPPRWSRFMMR